MEEDTYIDETVTEKITDEELEKLPVIDSTRSLTWQFEQLVNLAKKKNNNQKKEGRVRKSAEKRDYGKLKEKLKARGKGKGKKKEEKGKKREGKGKEKDIAKKQK